MMIVRVAPLPPRRGNVKGGACWGPCYAGFTLAVYVFLAPAVTLVRERQALLQEQLRVQLGSAPDEQTVLRLLREGLVRG